MASFTLRPALVALALVLAAAARLPAQSEEEATSTEPLTVELFQAIDDEQITVSVVPRDARRLTLSVTNETERPLSIQMPGAVLAQFNNPFNFDANTGRTNTQQRPQSLGFGFPANQNVQQQPFGDRFGNLFQRAPFDQGGLFQVPAGRTVRVRLPCVCLEHGLPTPSPRHAYTLAPLTSFSEDPELAALLESFSYGNYTQREAQAAAWHLANDMDWEELAALRVEHLRAPAEPRFETRELEHAQEMVNELPQQMKPLEPFSEESPGETEAASPGEVASRE